MGRNMIWDDFGIRECIFNVMLILKIKRMPTVKEIQSIEKISFRTSKNGVVSATGKNAYFKIHNKFGGVEALAKEYNLPYMGEKEMLKCPICKKSFMVLQEHHIFFGTGDRKISDKYEECKIKICVQCHEGTNGVHGKNGHKLNQKLKIEAQEKFVKKFGIELFMKEFGRNYILEEDEEYEI